MKLSTATYPVWTLYLTTPEQIALHRGEMSERAMRRLASAIPKAMYRAREPDIPSPETILADMGATTDEHEAIVAIIDTVRAEVAAQAPPPPKPIAAPRVTAWPELVLKQLDNGLPRIRKDKRCDWGSVFFAFTQRDQTPNFSRRAKSWSGFGPKGSAFRQRYRQAAVKRYGEKVLGMLPTLALSAEQAAQLEQTCRAMIREGERLRALSSYTEER